MQYKLYSPINQKNVTEFTESLNVFQGCKQLARCFFSIQVTTYHEFLVNWTKFPHLKGLKTYLQRQRDEKFPDINDIAFRNIVQVLN